MKSANPSPFFAAKLLEQACTCVELQLEGMDAGEEARKLAIDGSDHMLEANILYQANGNFERALESIQKGARVCEQHAPDRQSRTT